MIGNGGRNPLRWNCETDGCFNKKQRPKIEEFHACFPGNISMGDLDGIVEIAGNALMLEWKAFTLDIPMGQSIMYERLTKGGAVTVALVFGNAETMEVQAFAKYFDGVFTTWENSDLNGVKKRFGSWATWAARNPRI